MNIDRVKILIVIISILSLLWGTYLYATRLSWVQGLSSICDPQLKAERDLNQQFSHDLQTPQGVPLLLRDQIQYSSQAIIDCEKTESQTIHSRDKGMYWSLAIGVILGVIYWLMSGKKKVYSPNTS